MTTVIVQIKSNCDILYAHVTTIKNRVAKFLVQISHVQVVAQTTKRGEREREKVKEEEKRGEEIILHGT